MYTSITVGSIWWSFDSIVYYQMVTPLVVWIRKDIKLVQQRWKTAEVLVIIFLFVWQHTICIVYSPFKVELEQRPDLDLTGDICIRLLSMAEECVHRWEMLHMQSFITLGPFGLKVIVLSCFVALTVCLSVPRSLLLYCPQPTVPTTYRAHIWHSN